MSFSAEVKNELARLETRDANSDKAELLALLRMSGAIVLRGLNIGIHFSTENAALARRVLQLLKNNYHVQTEVVITRSRRRFHFLILTDLRRSMMTTSICIQMKAIRQLQDFCQVCLIEMNISETIVHIIIFMSLQ